MNARASQPPAAPARDGGRTAASGLLGSRRCAAPPCQVCRRRWTHGLHDRSRAPPRAPARSPHGRQATFYCQAAYCQATCCQAAYCTTCSALTRMRNQVHLLAARLTPRLIHQLSHALQVPAPVQTTTCKACAQRVRACQAVAALQRLLQRLMCELLKHGSGTAAGTSVVTGEGPHPLYHSSPAGRGSPAVARMRRACAPPVGKGEEGPRHLEPVFPLHWQHVAAEAAALQVRRCGAAGRHRSEHLRCLRGMRVSNARRSTA